LFAKAHLLDPTNGPYLAAYELARQQWVGTMLQTAKYDQKAGKDTAAKQQLEQALNLDPDNPFVQEHIQSLDAEREPAVIESRPMPKFATGLVELAPAQIQSTFHLRGTAQDILQRWNWPQERSGWPWIRPMCWSPRTPGRTAKNSIDCC
jgi:hypothetical protein